MEAIMGAQWTRVKDIRRIAKETGALHPSIIIIRYQANRVSNSKLKR